MFAVTENIEKAIRLHQKVKRKPFSHKERKSLIAVQREMTQFEKNILLGHISCRYNQRKLGNRKRNEASFSK